MPQQINKNILSMMKTSLSRKLAQVLQGKQMMLQTWCLTFLSLMIWLIRIQNRTYLSWMIYDIKKEPSFKNAGYEGIERKDFDFFADA